MQRVLQDLQATKRGKTETTLIGVTLALVLAGAISRVAPTRLPVPDRFTPAGLDPHSAPQAAPAATNGLLNRHAAMLVCNDASLVLGGLLLLTLPLLFFLPGLRARL